MQKISGFMMHFKVFQQGRIQTEAHTADRNLERFLVVEEKPTRLSFKGVEQASLRVGITDAKCCEKPREETGFFYPLQR
jgi:hypothetical protein